MLLILTQVYSRTLINLAYGLNHNKELRDLFIDLVEKYIEPCKQLSWSVPDVKMFLEVYADAGCQLEVMKRYTFNWKLSNKL